MDITDTDANVIDHFIFVHLALTIVIVLNNELILYYIRF